MKRRAARTASSREKGNALEAGADRIYARGLESAGLIERKDKSHGREKT